MNIWVSNESYNRVGKESDLGPPLGQNLGPLEFHALIHPGGERDKTLENKDPDTRKFDHASLIPQGILHLKNATRHENQSKKREN